MVTVAAEVGKGDSMMNSIARSSITAGLAATFLVTSSIFAQAAPPDSPGDELVALGANAFVQSEEGTAVSVLDDGTTRLGGESESVEISVPDDTKIEEPAQGHLIAYDSTGEMLFAAQIVNTQSATEAGSDEHIVSDLEGDWATAEDGRLVASSGGNEDVVVVMAASYINRVERGTDRGQPRYLVYPTVLGRVSDVNVVALQGWVQARSMGVPSQVNLRDQFKCHPLSQVARVKASWNLESWRPSVGLLKTIAAQCNPQ